MSVLRAFLWPLAALVLSGAAAPRKTFPVPVSLAGAPLSPNPVNVTGAGTVDLVELSKPLLAAPSAVTERLALPSARIPGAVLQSAVRLPAAASTARKPFAERLRDLGAAFGRSGARSWGFLRGFFDGGLLGGGDGIPRRPEDYLEFEGERFPRRLFSDRERIAPHLVAAIGRARGTIDIAIHGLSLSEVAKALLEAKRRGVRIRIVMNESHVFPKGPRQSRSPEVQFLIDNGFEMRTLKGGGSYGVMHNKFAIFDGALLETGSYNWSKSAEEQHYENALFSDDAHRIAGFQAYWDWMWAQTKPLAGGEDLVFGPPAPPVDPETPVRFHEEAFPAYAFSPRGVTEARLVRAIGLSKRSIDVAMFSFTSPELHAALSAAKARGVAVRIVFDAANARALEVMKRFVDEGFDVLISNGPDGRRGVHHNKFAVFDGLLLETGSYNWTENADRNNYENANFFDEPDQVADYLAYFERIRARARRPTPEDLRITAQELELLARDRDLVGG